MLSLSLSAHKDGMDADEEQKEHGTRPDMSVMSARRRPRKLRIRSKKENGTIPIMIPNMCPRE